MYNFRYINFFSRPNENLNMDINRDHEEISNVEIVKLNDNFGITIDGTSLVTFTDQKISLQILNGDISGIINILKNSKNNHEELGNDDFEEELAVNDLQCCEKKPDRTLLNNGIIENLKQEQQNILIEFKEKYDIGDTNKSIIQYQNYDDLSSNRLIKEKSIKITLEDSTEGDKFLIDLEKPSCSKSYYNEVNPFYESGDLQEKTLPNKTHINSSQWKSNPIKGKSLLNSNRCVVKSSKKGKATLKYTESQNNTDKSDKIENSGTGNHNQFEKNQNNTSQLKDLVVKAKLKLKESELNTVLIKSDLKNSLSKTESNLNIENSKPAACLMNLTASDKDVGTSVSKTAENLKETIAVKKRLQGKKNSANCLKATTLTDLVQVNSTANNGEYLKSSAISNLGLELCKSNFTYCLNPTTASDVVLNVSKIISAECLKPQLHTTIDMDLEVSEYLKQTTATDIEVETIMCDSEERLKPAAVTNVDLEVSKFYKSYRDECLKPATTAEIEHHIDIHKNKPENSIGCTKSRESTPRMDISQPETTIFKKPSIPTRKMNKYKTSNAISCHTKPFVSSCKELNKSDQVLFKKPNQALSRLINVKRKRPVVNIFNISELDDVNHIAVTSKTLSDKPEIELGRCLSTECDTTVQSSANTNLLFSHENVVTSSAEFYRNRSNVLDDHCNESITAEDSSKKCTPTIFKKTEQHTLKASELTGSEDKIYLRNDDVPPMISEKNILWSSGDDIEIIKKTSEPIDLEGSDVGSEYSVSSLYEEIVKQKLFIERPEGYPRIRVRTDLMPRTTAEGKFLFDFLPCNFFFLIELFAFFHLKNKNYLFNNLCLGGK